MLITIPLFIYFFYNANNNKKRNESTSAMKNGLNL